MKILGGISGYARVQMWSADYTTTATYRRGDIATKIESHSRFSRFLSRHRKTIFPKTLRLMLEVLSSCSIKMLLYTLAYIVMVALMSSLVHSRATHQLGVSFSPSALCLLSFGNTSLLVAVLFFYSHKYVASWHGAEHMAIAAYDRQGSTELGAIANEGPIHQDCGSRFVVAVVPMACIVYVAAGPLGFSPGLGVLIGTEALLWFDDFVGLGKVPVFWQLSWLLQRFVTTRRPGLEEMRTAQAAVRALEATHAGLSALDGK